MNGPLELGLDTFGDVTVDANDRRLTHAEVLRNVVAEAVLADELGIDFIGLGEHHRPDFAISAPEIVLAAIASRTKRIRLGTSVTVLSSDDAIRVFERFSTLNAISNGRAEIILGRGSFTESFPLFGFDLADYQTLFDEKLDLFAKLLESDREQKPFDWQGTTRAPLANARVYPPLGGAPLKVWIGVGGSPESVLRAARYRFPLMLAIIGGAPSRFAPYVDLYERALAKAGSERLDVGVHSPGHVAATDAEAREQLWPAYREMRNRIGAERGWGPTSRAEFDRECESGSLYVGAPDTVAAKIASTVEELRLSRFDLKYSSGPLPHDWMRDSVALYGREVIPRVRALLAGRKR
jgi:probable LLM family oxidoreductase